jgi:hypothetical protein
LCHTDITKTNPVYAASLFIIEWLLHPSCLEKKQTADEKDLPAGLFISVICNLASARHIKGGWVQYSYLGPGSAQITSTYTITVYVFRDCTQTGPMPTALGIYDAVLIKCDAAYNRYSQFIYYKALLQKPLSIHA